MVTSSEDSPVVAQAMELVSTSSEEAATTELAQGLELVLKDVMRVEAGKNTTELTELKELKELKELSELREAVTELREVKEAVMVLTLLWTKELKEVKVEKE